ncbi:hypothetical protein [Sphingobacterium siyangense]|jgi:hypothetical protein|nr:hypothetical protein [Sphingobacterium siyangense]
MASYEISGEFGVNMSLPKTRCKEEDNMARKKQKSTVGNCVIL